MLGNGYRLIIILSMAILLMSSCSQSLRKESSPDMIHTDHSEKRGMKKQENTPTREVLGFYTEQEGTYPSSQPTVDSQATKLSSIAPFWYKLDEKRPGSLLEFVSTEHKRNVIQSAHAKHVKVYLLVHNLKYETVEKGKQVASSVLANETNRGNFIQNVQKEINKFGYDGINIDMENLYMSNRDVFSEMIKKLSDALHRDKKIVTVSVPANTGDARANPWSPWFDYRKLGQYADRLIIMTYDEHNPRTPPGPTASVDWTEATIRYAINKGVPPSKILLGIAGYGWDWDTTSKQAKYSSYALLMAQKTKYKATNLWDSRSQAPHFSYADDQEHIHQAWFENSYSLRFKLDLVKKYNLKGIGIWRLGLEDPGYWNAISEKIKAEK